MAKYIGRSQQLRADEKITACGRKTFFVRTHFSKWVSPPYLSDRQHTIRTPYHKEIKTDKTTLGYNYHHKTYVDSYFI